MRRDVPPRPFALVLLLLCLGCSSASRPTAANALASLVINASDLPHACVLSRRLNPLFLSSASEDDRRFFAVTLRFWTGDAHEIPVDSLESGLSDVLATFSRDGALVMIALRFKTEDQARETQDFLAKRYEGNKRYALYGKGTLLIMCAHFPEVGDECFDSFWKQIVQRANSA